MFILQLNEVTVPHVINDSPTQILKQTLIYGSNSGHLRSQNIHETQLTLLTEFIPDVMLLINTEAKVTPE